MSRCIQNYEHDPNLILGYKTAMRIEEESRVSYVDQARQSRNPELKRFFEVMAQEKRGQYLQLLDCVEYLTGYSFKTRCSLDG